VEVLNTEIDYNAYCYYVAGTVGHLSTDLVIQHYGLADGIANQLKQNCEACGRGLQKTNIVKDFAQDLKRGVSYIPATWLQEIDYSPLALQGAPPVWTAKVLHDVLAELKAATAYVLALPYEAVGYRIASLLCLLPAYETLALAKERSEQLFTAAHQVKISRPTMLKCVERAKTMVKDNRAIIAYGQQRQQTIGQTWPVADLVFEL
jgi:farnesyl-diphosphate farnesyltransferase